VASAAIFRDMTARDAEAGLALSRLSGWNQTEEDWSLLLEPPSVFRAATLDDRVIGCAGAMVYGKRLAWVCMVLVDPAERSHGVASRLVGEVLERLPEVEAVGLDATPLGVPVYARLGFAPAGTLARLETRAPASGLPVPARVRPILQADLADILLRDLEVFGANREPLLRRAWSAAPELAWCLGDPAAGPGYGFGRRGANATQIGPVVAEGDAAALDIVAASLARRPGERFFLDAPAWTEWRSALARLGFQEQRPFTRMYRGGHHPRSLPSHSYAVFGPEFG
jgi:GNAT superfamily N-acetyltransferase